MADPLGSYGSGLGVLAPGKNPFITAVTSAANGVQAPWSPAVLDAANNPNSRYLYGNSGSGAVTLGANTNYSAPDPYASYGGQAAYNNQVSSYDQAINNTQAAVNRSGAQLNSGYTGIESSLQNALNSLLLGKNQANTAYTGQKKTTATDYVKAKNTIGSNAGATLSGLLRLLGSKGAGGGSAYNFAAPQAVTRGATLQRADAADQFGANNQALDTSYNSYLTGYNNEVSSAKSQRDQQRQALEQSVNNNKASLLQTLAQLSAEKASYTGGNSAAAAQPYVNQANSILDSLSNYTVKPITYNTQAYKAPSLASYSTNPQAAPTYNGQAPANDYFSPYLQALLGKKQLAGA